MDILAAYSDQVIESLRLQDSRSYNTKVACIYFENMSIHQIENIFDDEYYCNMIGCLLFITSYSSWYFNGRSDLIPVIQQANFILSQECQDGIWLPEISSHIRLTVKSEGKFKWRMGSYIRRQIVLGTNWTTCFARDGWENDLVLHSSGTANVKTACSSLFVRLSIIRSARQSANLSGSGQFYPNWGSLWIMRQKLSVTILHPMPGQIAPKIWNVQNI